MTKVTLRYGLARSLGEEDLENLALVHRTYGMSRVQPGPGQNQITVDYDASRLMQKDVEAVLTRHAIPIRLGA